MVWIQLALYVVLGGLVGYLLGEVLENIIPELAPLNQVVIGKLTIAALIGAIIGYLYAG